MNWIVLMIAVLGITLIFFILGISAIEIYKEHVKLDRKKNLELKNLNSDLKVR